VRGEGVPPLSAIFSVCHQSMCLIRLSDTIPVQKDYFYTFNQDIPLYLMYSFLLCASSSFTKVGFFESGQTGDECLILASEMKTESSDSLYACAMYARIYCLHCVLTVFVHRFTRLMV